MKNSDRMQDETALTRDARYEYIGAALRYLEENAERQPSLDDVAAHIGFSPTHFQRMFTAWVGVSPKKYLGYLTLDHAKRLLAERHTVLETSFETGLSSPSRLHDLFVSWEAMSPGAFAMGGEGLTLRYGWADSPFGPAFVAATEQGICGLGFGAETGRAATEAEILGRWPAATPVNDAEYIAPLVEAAFAGKGRAKLALCGAPFQVKVWEALLAIPSGHVTTYSDIARAIGHPKAVRAVGTAVGRNPIAWLIPCHRAIRKSGGLGGYHWGLGVKRAMLAYESARADAHAAAEDAAA